jgi:hypothetical protein
MTCNTFTTTATSDSLIPAIACAELASHIDVADTAFMLVFCSSQYDLSDLANCLHDAFGDLPCYGCTTAGEFAGNGYQKQSIVVQAFSQRGFSCSSALVENLDEFNLVDAKELMESLQQQLMHTEGFSAQNAFVLSLVDGLSAQEEKFLLDIDSAMVELPHFGGSAGDDQMLNNTYVMYHGQFYDSAAVVLQISCRQKFAVFSVNHIQESLAKLVVTDADPKTRQVFEINAEPAAEVYAQMIGKTVDTLEPDDYALHPLAVKVGDAFYIRSIQQATSAFHSLSFYCAVDKGIVLNQVSLGSINDALSDKLTALSSELGPPSLVLGMDCFLRRIEVENKTLCAQTKALHERFNMVGFNAYGEHIKGIHLNQTFTGVYISEQLDG